MKQRLLYLAPLVAILVSLFSFAIPTVAHAASVAPSPDGKNHLRVTLTGTSNPSGYSLTASHSTGGSSTETVGFSYDSGSKTYLSDGLTATGSDCAGSTAIQQVNQIQVVVKKSGKQVGSGSFSLCGKGSPYIFPESIQVSQQAQNPASFVVKNMTYTSDAGGKNPFGSSTDATLVGGPNNQTYNLKFDSSGNSNKISNLTPGTYKFTADYNPPNPSDGVSDRHYEKTITLSAGQNYVLANVNVDKSVAETVNGQQDNSTQETCDDGGFALSWIVCRIIDDLDSGVDWVYTNIIAPMLQTDAINLSKPSEDPTHMYDIWSTFRIYGDIILVLILLVIVFGESIGGGLIDAYTAKKVLPRLLIAAILINLSIYVVALAVDFTNIVGKGIADLLQHPFQSQIDSGNFYTLHIGAGAGVIGSSMVAIVGALFAGLLVTGHAAVIGAGIAYLAVMFLLPAFLVMLAILATVVVRRGLILLLILVSPIAFALYCLPNTEQYFRKWWDLLFKTLLVYPVIAVMFALGNILSVTISSTTSGLLTPIADFIGAISMFVPLFLIPFAFRIAGGLLARFHELATTAANRGHQAIIGSEQDPDSMRNRARRRFAVERTRSGLTGKATANRLARPQDLFTQEGRRRRSSRQAAIREAGLTRLGGQFSESDMVFQANQKNDQYLLALANEQLALRKRQAALSAGNMTEVAAWDQAINAARATPQHAAAKMAALQGLAATGFQLDQGQEGYNQLAETVANITGAELQRDAAGNAIGARGVNAGAFANAMNQAQFNLRSAGRFDLGGINNGERYNAKGGTDKASLYELANAKPESIQALTGGLTGPVGLDHAVVYKELEAMLPNAKGATRDQIEIEMANLRNAGVETFMDQPAGGVGRPKSVRVPYNPSNPTHVATWSAAEKTAGFRVEQRAETNRDEAQRRARNYERPDPNNLNT